MDPGQFIRLVLIIEQYLNDELEEERCLRSARRRRWRRIAAICDAESFEQENHSIYCSINNTMPILKVFFEGGETKTDFRLNRRSIIGLLDLMDQSRHHGWGPTLETLVFLFWLASGTSYRIVSRSFDMPRSTVNDLIHRVATALTALVAKVIRLPSPEEQREIGEGFARLADHEAFQRSMGAIDGCHIRIKAPGEPDAQCYLNRKLFPSIQLQAVCDHVGKFIDVFVGFPGSVHDARILRYSPLFHCATYPPPDTFLLGDGGYPCLERPICLLTPYKQPVRGEAQQRFNFHHSQARSIIERAFGMMKTRWRAIFLSALEVDTKFVPDVILACTILHNICITNGDLVAVDEEEDDHVEREGGETASGSALRDYIATQL